MLSEFGVEVADERAQRSGGFGEVVELLREERLALGDFLVLVADVLARAARLFKADLGAFQEALPVFLRLTFLVRERRERRVGDGSGTPLRERLSLVAVELLSERASSCSRAEARAVAPSSRAFVSASRGCGGAVRGWSRRAPSSSRALASGPTWPAQVRRRLRVLREEFGLLVFEGIGGTFFVGEQIVGGCGEAAEEKPLMMVWMARARRAPPPALAFADCFSASSQARGGQRAEL